MKRVILNLHCLLAVFSATAQNFTNLHSFDGSDGSGPYAGLVLSGNTLYGTAYSGGLWSNGTIFAINTDGSGFAQLYNFTATSANFKPNSDGAFPNGLILSGSTLYGTAQGGGSSGKGTVFGLNIDGTGFTNLHSFTALTAGTNSGGAHPRANLLLLNGTLYGATEYGGNFARGTLFAVSADGTVFTNLHSFTTTFDSLSTNVDGANPRGSLLWSGNALYGTAQFGGSSGNGTLFSIKSDGSGFTNLHSFTALASNTNSDGSVPYAGLILSGNVLYGVAYYGGSAGNGTVFAINTDGTGFTNLHSFATLVSNTNSDGANPYSALVLSGNTLYGTAVYGGSAGNGAVFSINTDGSGFTNLHSFTALLSNTNRDGAYPAAGLILSGNTLFGTSWGGGSSGKGTVFGLSLPLPRLTIIPSDTNVILTWTNAAFGLQTAPAITDPFTNLPGATSPYTNPISGAQQFFRLISN